MSANCFSFWGTRELPETLFPDPLRVHASPLDLTRQGTPISQNSWAVAPNEHSWAATGRGKWFITHLRDSAKRRCFRSSRISLSVCNEVVVKRYVRETFILPGHRSWGHGSHVLWDDCLVGDMGHFRQQAGRWL